MSPAPYFTIDTEERKATVRRLTEALYDYLTQDVRDMERRAELAPTTSMVPMPTYDPQEAMMQAVEQRDALQSQLDEMLDAIKGLPEAVAVPMRHGVGAMIEMQIRSQDNYISSLQAAIERSSPMTENKPE